MAHEYSPSAADLDKVTRANGSGRQPVVFVHGLWLLDSSWDPWVPFFEEADYSAVAPSWPDDPPTVELAREDPSVFAGKGIGDIAAYQQQIIEKLDTKPAIIGHSFGGLLAQILAGRGLSAATVAVDPAPSRGVLPLPLAAVKSSAVVLTNPANPAPGGGPDLRAVPLRLRQRRQRGRSPAALLAVSRGGLRDTDLPGRLRQLQTPAPTPRADKKNPDRGPMLIIGGEKDHQVPWAIANATYKEQSENPGVTEVAEIPDRGHSLTIDSGWQEVAQTCLDFIRRFV
jgi:pimeloyl-ACP methyl ester carboxylesterase